MEYTNFYKFRDSYKKFSDSYENSGIVVKLYSSFTETNDKKSFAIMKNFLSNEITKN